MTAPTPEPAEQPTRKPVLVGTGMPQSTLLEAFGQWVRDAFGHHAYHVGSSLHGKTWRDVDVRLILPDDEFDALFPGYRFGNQTDAKWGLLCAALSTLGAQQTGLPIDFQIQSMTEANTRFGDFAVTPRNPLHLFDHYSAQREIERSEERAADAQGEKGKAHE